MKIIKYIFSFILISGLVTACSDDDAIRLDESAKAPDLEVSASDFVLESEHAEEEAIRFSWNELDLNVNTPVRYILQLAKGDAGFSDAKTLQSSGSTSYSMTVKALNAQAISLGIEPDEEGTLDARVVARIGSSGGANYESEVKTLTITPYTDVLDLTSSWGIVGDATPNGWDGPDIPLYQTGKEGVLVAYASLTDGEIKFREDNSWDNDLGGSDGALEAGGDNIKVEEGTYKITVDLNALTYTLEEFSLGVVGDATPNGWDGPDAELAFDPTSGKFRALVELTDGEIKFRLNNKWGDDWGGSDGELDSDGENIAVEAGTYVISVDLDEETYTLEPIENVWGVVGDATPNGWDGPDVVMKIDYTSDYASGKGVWYADNVELTEGTLKFRANNEWSLDYGSDDADGNLGEGEDNIPVESDGNYDIIFNLDEMTYRIEAH